MHIPFPVLMRSFRLDCIGKQFPDIVWHVSSVTAHSSVLYVYIKKFPKLFDVSTIHHMVETKEIRQFENVIPEVERLIVVAGLETYVQHRHVGSTHFLCWFVDQPGGRIFPERNIQQ